MDAIVYNNVCKKYKNAKAYAVDHVNANIHEGEFVTILGVSGCGKTTLLKMTNRLIESDEGTITVSGKEIKSLDPVELRRHVGYVIQQIGLFPHMTIAQNIEVRLELLHVDKKNYKEIVDGLLRKVALNPDDFRDCYPSQLSGGQQQRVGLARALAGNPKVMLLDEPFGAIDAITRRSMQKELKRLHEENKRTFLLVTHDIDEAFLLGDRVMVMNEGHLLQFDTPETIIDHPADEFVKTLVESSRESSYFYMRG